jgi:hypothetical protein
VRYPCVSEVRTASIIGVVILLTVSQLLQLLESCHIYICRRENVKSHGYTLPSPSWLEEEAIEIFVAVMCSFHIGCKINVLLF